MQCMHAARGSIHVRVLIRIYSDIVANMSDAPGSVPTGVEAQPAAVRSPFVATGTTAVEVSAEMVMAELENLKTYLQSLQLQVADVHDLIEKKIIAGATAGRPTTAGGTAPGGKFFRASLRLFFLLYVYNWSTLVNVCIII